MVNCFLIGLDEREREFIPKWQLRLVDDLDAFNAFPWGSFVYKYSIYGFNNALCCLRELFEQRQEEKGIGQHQKERYNIYGLTYALLMFVDVELKATEVERGKLYYQGINEGDNLYLALGSLETMLNLPLEHNGDDDENLIEADDIRPHTRSKTLAA
ncbi:hypothetical protein Dsin_028386 [Dipteronia sinensis]|uniref:DUF1985 domain-containing protein n=1 Tax=Dipteronia sinensis TaxID=43782 RepID=A0AAD9ZR70_9ROSI|nr:hypothetical protein Dsin_028386 [Dipteronia sinensis]